MTHRDAAAAVHRVSPGELCVVVPNDIDDPAAPSGGNRYDREVCDALRADGWKVLEHAAYGAWPRPAPADLATLDDLLAGLPEAVPVLVDGLIASAAPDVMAAHAQRLRLIALVHMPLGDADEAARPAELTALRAARVVVATSGWTRDRLSALYGLSSESIRVATPGVCAAPPATGSDTGNALLCVAVVGPHKGHDVLVGALAQVADLPWTCVCAGAVDRDPGFVHELMAAVRVHGLHGRLRFAGPQTAGELDTLYATSDLLVHPSRGETYGMVAAEALARGTPVLATTAKGLPDAVGHAPDGTVPGLLVPPDDPEALAGALRLWLRDPDARRRLRTAALARRETLTDWTVTARKIAEAVRDIPNG